VWRAEISVVFTIQPPVPLVSLGLARACPTWTINKNMGEDEKAPTHGIALSVFSYTGFADK